MVREYGIHTEQRALAPARRAFAAAAMLVFSAMLAAALSGCAAADSEGADAGDSLDAVGEAIDGARDEVRDALGGVRDDIDGALEAAGDAASSLAGASATLSEAIAGLDKAAYAVVRDAQDGEEIAHVSDAAALREALSSLSLVRLVSSRPDAADAAPEYAVELWQDETRKLGQAPDDVESVRVLTFTTFEGSDCVEIRLEGVADAVSTWDFQVSDEFADALRGLADAS